MPFIDNDPSYKELYDKGIPLELVDDDIKSKYSFYEHTPYSNKPEYEWINNNFNKHYIFMLNLGIEIMQHIAVTIGKEKYYFDIYLIDLKSDQTIFFDGVLNFFV